VQVEQRRNAEKLAALLVPWETAALDEVQAGDFAIICMSAAGLAGGAVAAAAGRLSPVIARRAPRPVEQATLRGAGGTLVLTPVGSGWKTGMALAVGLRPGGALARLEILARRAAAAHDPKAQVVAPHDAMPVARLDTTPPPTAAAAAAQDLEVFGPLQAQSYREPTSGVLIHCFVPPGASAAELALFAWELAQAMAQGPQAGPLGSFDSAVLRSGTERVEIRRLPSAAGPSPVLVVGVADTGRPGLARLQVERAAARLGGA
jgi:predicted regulator of Ras-like GTPase activity (Roadblock/LC7/MglB family)